MKVTRGSLERALREQAGGNGGGGGGMGGNGGSGSGGGMAMGGTSGKAISAPALSLGFGTDPRWFHKRKRCKYGRQKDGTCRDEPK